MKKVIYHASCHDGFGAAWAVWKALGDAVTYIPMHHGDDPENCRGDDLIIVDFSFKRDVMERLLEQANSILILDHHISAKDDLAILLLDQRLQGQFDLNRSGAMMTWEWFHPETPVPDLIRHIEDQDLWRFKYPNTQAICLALTLYPMEFAAWDKLDVRQLNADGKILLPYRRHQIDKLKSHAFIGTIAGYQVPIVNCGISGLVSDVVGELAEEHPFAACYVDLEKYRVYSLRSTQHGVDVAKIAKSFGGGGHQRASGFHIARPPVCDDELNLES